MGLRATDLKYILMVKKKYGIKGPVITLGNQDIYATEKELSHWVVDAGLPLRIPSTIYYSESQSVKKINRIALKYVHAKTFFEFIGIPNNEYYDIDKFPFDNPVILHDLQKPIDARYYNFFNFVLDSGTMEHIFDVKSVMANIVRITKVGGYVLQLLPAHNFLNHGFYQFSPTLFYDFYTTNGFEVVEAYLIEIRGNYERFYKYDQKKDYVGLFFDPRNRLGNCFLVRKIKQVGDIASPDQFFYRQLSENPMQLERDFSKTLLDKIVKVFQKIIPIKFHGLFFRSWAFLKRITINRTFFDIKG